LIQFLRNQPVTACKQYCPATGSTQGWILRQAQDDKIEDQKNQARQNGGPAQRPCGRAFCDFDSLSLHLSVWWLIY